jgi:poly(3-hydroxybutyrate) depolymerase
MAAMRSASPPPLRRAADRPRARAHGRIAGAAAAALLALPLAMGGGARAAEPLPRLAIDPAQVSVSGLSAGGYMAVQLQVAYSSVFRAGAGVVAGGPYDCAEGSVLLATGRCTDGPGEIPVARLVDTTERRAREGRIDPTAALAGAKVYLFSGQRDSVVRPAVVDALAAYYRRYVPEANLVYRRDVAAEHAMVTDDYGAGCATKAPPYLNDCDLDLAGAMLRHLHGPLAPRNDGPPAGRLLEFDQTAFVRGHGLAATGQVYLPAACAAVSGAPAAGGTGAGPAACRLHVALHGCRQNTAEVGLRYVQHAGYNRWADTNRIVVLYPQTGAGAVNGCWDWWGYDSADYAVRAGPQMAAVKAMADQLLGHAPTPPVPAAACITASNYAHTAAGRAHARFGFAYANGSNDAMGWWTIFHRSTLKETAPGHFAVQDCQGASRS